MPSKTGKDIGAVGSTHQSLSVSLLLLNHCSFVYFLVRQSMGVLSGPQVDLTLLLRQTVSQTDSFLPFALLGLVLFVSVCLLLCQLIVYIWWKLGQGRQGVRFYHVVHVFPHVETIPLR